MSKAVFSAIDSFTWLRLMRWIRRKYEGKHRLGMKDLRRRFCDKGWRFACNGVVFTGAGSRPIPELGAAVWLPSRRGYRPPPFLSWPAGFASGPEPGRVFAMRSLLADGRGKRDWWISHSRFGFWPPIPWRRPGRGWRSRIDRPERSGFHHDRTVPAGRGQGSCGGLAPGIACCRSGGAWPVPGYLGWGWGCA